MRSIVNAYQARSRIDGSLHTVVAYRSLAKMERDDGSFEMQCIGPVELECEGFDFVEAVFSGIDPRDSECPAAFRCIRGNEPDQIMDRLFSRSSCVTLDHSGHHVPKAEERRSFSG